MHTKNLEVRQDICMESQLTGKEEKVAICSLAYMFLGWATDSWAAGSSPSCGGRGSFVCILFQ